MKNYSVKIASGLNVQVCDYEASSGEYLLRINVEMILTVSRGPESEYEPEQPQLYSLVYKVMSKRRAGQAAPGSWDVRDHKELAEIIEELRTLATTN